MLSPTSGAARRAASTYLRQLLLKPGAYRARWEQHVVRARGEEISKLAVAEVLAGHLRVSPRTPADAGMQPQRLKDTVSRGLSGDLLSRATLALFVDAFGISSGEADRLWGLWNGSAMIGVLAGSHAVPPEAEQDLAKVLGPRRHQTVSMHDHVYVDADGRLERTRTLQVIEAIVPEVSRFPFLYDTSALTLEVGQGCQGLSGELRQIGPGVFATEIVLSRTLAIGETLTMEYWITYRLPGNLADPAEREYRRGVLGHLENYDMRIEFSPQKLPAQLWWSRWNGVAGEVTEQTPVTLDSQHAAHRFLRSVDRTVVGFRWVW